MKRILRFEGTFSSLYSNILHAQYQRKQYERFGRVARRVGEGHQGGNRN